MRIAIADDLARDRNDLADLIREAGTACRCRTDIDDFETGEELLSVFRPFSYSLIFLDIFMDGFSGIETARKIRETDPEVKIIFVTTSSDHMPEAFDVHAFHYLLKTDGREAMRSRITRLLAEVLKEEAREPEAFRFISDRHETALPYSSILCMESSGHYTVVTDRRLKKYRIRMTFSEATAALSHDRRFLIINRGVLVNMDYIRSFEKGICTLKYDLSFSVNVKRAREIDEQRQKYVFSRLHDDMKAKQGGRK